MEKTGALEWDRWFAWYPVKMKDGTKYRWAWLIYVERKIEGFAHPTDGWEARSYRKLKKWS